MRRERGRGRKLAAIVAVASGRHGYLARLAPPCSFLAIALLLQHRTTTGSTSTFTNLPSACPTTLSARWDTRTNSAGTLPTACAPGSVPRSLLPHDRPSSSFGHVAHGCDTAQPVAAQWRRRPRRTRRRQPRSRGCAPPSRRRYGPAGPPQNNDAQGAAAAAATAPACACLLCPTGVASRSLSRHCRRTGAGRASALELG